MKEKISPFQLFTLAFMVPFGSAVLFTLAPEAKQNAWIAILIYILPALLLQQLYITLYRYYPKDTIVTYLPKIFGKVIGTPLSILYILYFVYLAARVLRDFSGLIRISSMPEVSVFMIGLLLIIAITFGVSRGFENLSRAVSTFFPGIMIFLTVMIILFYKTPNVVILKNLFPMLEDGIVPIILKTWKLITFPYGEMIFLTMIYCNVDEPKKMRKAVFAAVIWEGIVLSALGILFVTGLGVNLTALELFPLLNALRMIRISGFMDRLDVFIVIVLVVDGFVKIGFFMYCSGAGISQLFNIKNKNALAWPLGVVILAASIFMAESYQQHLYIGLDITPKYIHLPLQVGIPLLALGIHYMKHGFRKPPALQDKIESNNESQGR